MGKALCRLGYKIPRPSHWCPQILMCRVSTQLPFSFKKVWTWFMTHVTHLSATSEIVMRRKTPHSYIFNWYSGIGNGKYFWSFKCRKFFLVPGFCSKPSSWFPSIYCPTLPISRLGIMIVLLLNSEFMFSQWVETSRRCFTNVKYWFSFFPPKFAQGLEHYTVDNVILEHSINFLPLCGKRTFRKTEMCRQNQFKQGCLPMKNGDEKPIMVILSLQCFSHDNPLLTGHWSAPVAWHGTNN